MVNSKLPNSTYLTCWKNAMVALAQLGRTTFRKVRIDELSPNDILIVLMGPTGSGKSTFIEVATGMKGLAGHGLATCTTTMSVIRLSFPNNPSNICFVDTPGFDDTTGSDIEVFQKITRWLNDTYRRNIRLSGLLYFHRISDNRMGGSLVKNFYRFEQICGKQFNRIVLITTMWDQIDEQTGRKREEELHNVYWKASIGRGSSVARFEHNRESAFEALGPILKQSNEKRRSVLLVQKEMADKGLKLAQTSAGKSLVTDPEGLVDTHERVLQRIQDELKKPTIEHDTLLTLTQEHKELSMQLPFRQPKKSLLKAKMNFFLRWFRRTNKTKSKHKRLR